MAVDESAVAAFTALSLVFIFIVGLGLGASTTIDDFRSAMEKPKAVLIGFLSQYLFLPVFSYLLCIVFDLKSTTAIGVILVGCSPGGTTSNIFSYWSKGDVALSITMSFLSTVAAFALMPFWIFVLVKTAYDSDVDIAWSNLIVGLLLILIPTCGGLYTRYTNTEYKINDKFIWEWIETGTTYAGIFFLLAALISSLVIYGAKFAEMDYKTWVIGIILQPLGCAFGYFVSKFFGMSLIDQRTISLETGVQNFTLTLAVINLTFKGDVLEEVLMYPLCYGIMYFANSALIVFLYRYLAELDDDDDEVDGDKIEKPTDVEAVPTSEDDLPLTNIEP
jgi:bile acid transporter